MARERPDGNRMVRRRNLGEGFHVSVATTLDQVVEAWELVHAAYTRAGLIDPNPVGLHTTPWAAEPGSMVMIGQIRELTVSTLTLMTDGDNGLPLDSVYPRELEAIRSEGMPLMEVGLLADRREHITRTLPAVFEMMRYVFYRAYFLDCEVVAGVHPHHAGFYRKYFAFTDAGGLTTHPTVKDNPVVLLRLPIRKTAELKPPPRGIASYLADPLPEYIFNDRYDFDSDEVRASRIGEYLELKGYRRSEPEAEAG